MGGVTNEVVPLTVGEATYILSRNTHTHTTYTRVFRFNSHQQYVRLCNWATSQSGAKLHIKLVFGSGYNANPNQQGTFDFYMNTSNGSSVSEGRYYSAYVDRSGYMTTNVYVVQNSTTNYDVYISNLSFMGSCIMYIECGSGTLSQVCTQTTIFPENTYLVPTNTIAYLTSTVAAANKWSTARTINIAGSVTGSASFDGSQDFTVNVSTNHNHDDRYYTESESDGRFFRYIGNNTNSNWTELRQTGNYRISQQSITNGPPGAYNYGQLITFNAGNTLTQIYFPHSSSGGPYTRTGWSGSEQYFGWINFWTSANFSPDSKANTSGTYSGLSVGYATNCDTVDGQHASAFAAAGHSHSQYWNCYGKSFSDFNASGLNGIYTNIPGNANCPSGSTYGCLVAFGGSSGQLYLHSNHTQSGSPRLWIRNGFDGARFSNWREVAYQDNISSLNSSIGDIGSLLDKINGTVV